MQFFKRLGKLLSRYEKAHNYTCDNCGQELFGGGRLCEKCKRELPYNNRTICPLCGRRVREAGVCFECKEKPLKTAKARSLWVHEGDAAKLVRFFKTGKKYLCDTFAEELVPLVKEEFAAADAVVCVPMTKKALRKRGYNQSRLLAEAVAKGTGKEFLDVLVKTRETADQRELTRREREENMEKCFSVSDKKSVKGKRILIVDDTLTTGATTSAVASVLQRAGALGVFAVTVTSVEYKLLV